MTFRMFIVFLMCAFTLSAALADEPDCPKGGDTKISPPSLISPSYGEITNDNKVILRWSSC